MDYLDMSSCYGTLPSPCISIHTASTCSGNLTPILAFHRIARYRGPRRINPDTTPPPRFRMDARAANSPDPLWYRRGACPPRRIITNIVFKDPPKTPWITRRFKGLRKRFS